MVNKYKDTIFDLSGKNAVVIGGAGQIGMKTVSILSIAGAQVMIFDSMEDSDIKERIEEEFKDINSKHITYEYLDITNKEQVKNAALSYIKKFKHLDILINHAHYKGDPKILKPHSPFFADLEEYPFEIWKDTINTNLNGLFLCTKYFGKLMKQFNEGVIVNTSSTYGIKSPKKHIYGDSGINNPISYATTKAAIINFSRYVATHWAPYGVRCNTLSPGGVRNKGQSDSFTYEYSKNTPLGRLAEANEYQGAILFLTSDASSYMTGANLVVDGGWTSW